MAAGLVLGFLFFVGFLLLVIGSMGTEGHAFIWNNPGCCVYARIVLSGAVMMCVAVLGGWAMGPWYGGPGPR
jgi:hypothetical protein